MTLLALVLAIGLVVDDAIVVLENVDRHIKLGETPFRAAIIGTAWNRCSGYFHDHCLDCSIFSNGVNGGITGTLFKEFAFNLAGAVFISGIVALTLSPMMTSKLLKSNAEPSKLEQRVEHTLSKVNAAYAYVLDLVMVNRKCMLMFAAIIFATLPVLFKSLSSELTHQKIRGILAIGSAPSNVNVGLCAKCDGTLSRDF